VRLLWVEGDEAAGFRDLMGAEGVLRPGEAGRTLFAPDGRGDWLQLAARPGDEADGGDGRIRISTRLGNVFVFLPLEARPLEAAR
jgi:hypothetical protein